MKNEDAAKSLVEKIKAKTDEVIWAWKGVYWLENMWDTLKISRFIKK